MKQYILKKILLLIPTLFLLAILVFFLSEMAPGDRVLINLDINGNSLTGENTVSKDDYDRIAHQLNLDLPQFYFSIHPVAYPDTLNKIVNPLIKDLIKSQIINNAKFYDIVPKIKWNGTNNRFHKWFGKVIKFDFGVSAIDGQYVIDKIGSSLKWTLLYIFIAYILALGLAIPLGLLSVYYDKKTISKFIDISTFVIYSMPFFWLSTLAVVFFTSSEITPYLNIFPSIGIGDISEENGVFKQILIAVPHLLLPSIVIALHSGAYLSTLIRKNMLKEIDKTYYLSLLARGLDKKTVILKHIFPNSMLPLVTLLIVSFPASLAGSVVTEVIFNIPGMGRLLYEAILKYDWNVVFAIVLLIGFITYLSYMIGDIIYSRLNPKITLNR